MTNLPLWSPSRERVERANLSRFVRFVQNGVEATVTDWTSLYDFSIKHPEKFWTAVWDFCGIRASGEREPVLVDKQRMPGARWFPNVRLNFAQNLLRHRDERIALKFRGESGVAKQLSYAELHEHVSGLSQALAAAGVAPGDRVAGFMPNLPETVIAMLATTSLGATWSSCSPDFGINGVVDRFGQIAPKVLFTADAYAYGGKNFDCLEKVRGILAQIPAIERVVVVPYLDSAPSLEGLRNAVLLPDFAPPSSQPINFSQQAFDHPLYVMYSSGTTGVP
jgi:acetoacetyl-CoA synthetase